MYTFTTFVAKRLAEQVYFNDLSSKSVLISIYSPPAVTPGSYAPKLIEGAWSHILKVPFHDADGSGRSIDNRLTDIIAKGHLQLFSEDQAVQILKFLKEHQEDHTQAIVHCEAGISRSAGVSKFIAQIYNLEFPENYSIYNRYVYSTLMKAYNSSKYGEGPLQLDELPGY